MLILINTIWLIMKTGMPNLAMFLQPCSMWLSMEQVRPSWNSVVQMVSTVWCTTRMRSLQRLMLCLSSKRRLTVPTISWRDKDSHQTTCNLFAMTAPFPKRSKKSISPTPYGCSTTQLTSLCLKVCVRCCTSTQRQEGNAWFFSLQLTTWWANLSTKNWMWESQTSMHWKIMIHWLDKKKLSDLLSTRSLCAIKLKERASSSEIASILTRELFLPWNQLASVISIKFQHCHFLPPYLAAQLRRPNS